MKTFTVSTRKITSFRRRLFAWYKIHGRTLPWRTTRDPYAIVVSEMMLQQTQVDRVVQRYHDWLKQFPSLAILAKAKTATVLRAWSGLGYNRRALALQHIAQTVVRDHAGALPKTPRALQRFNGIGQYTAHAVSIFAFEQNVPLVDTNIKRVLGRIFFGYQQLALYRNTNEPFWELSTTITLHGGKAYTLNQALMDFGATVCTAKTPHCTHCPLRTICRSYPDIIQASSDQLRVKTQRPEPHYFGQPRRIWRGRILRYLHTQRQAASLSAIGRMLQSDWTDERTSWLKPIIVQMAKEGLVRLQADRVKI